MKANINYFRNLLIILCPVFLFTGCLTQKKLSELVQSKVENEVISNHQVESKFIVLNTDSLNMPENSVVVKKGKSYFIPAILVWAWSQKLNCEISGQYFSSVFASILTEKSKEFNLDKHLGNKKLEITLIEVPSRFIYSNNGYFVYGLVLYAYGFGELINPDHQNFIFQYRITENGTELKSNRFEFMFANQLLNSKFSTNKFIEKYVDQLKADFEIKSNEFIDRIIEDL